MDEQIMMLIQHGDDALSRNDKETALEFYKGASELGSDEAMDKIKQLNPQAEINEQEIIENKVKYQESENQQQLKEKYASLSGLSAFLILGIVLQAVAATFSLISSNWATLFALIPALIVNVAILSVLDIIGNLVIAVNQIQKKPK